jgi:cytoskeletal protein CcmA (bactofilin family)
MSIFTRSGEGNGKSSEVFGKDLPGVRPRGGSEPSHEVSIVGSGVRIEGDIHVEGDVRVGGRITGAVVVQDRIVMAAEGVILGGIEAGEGDIAGTVEGDVRTRGRLVLRSSASIHGQISAEHLVMEEGAAISGNCQVGKLNRVEKSREGLGDGADGDPTLPLD